MFERISKNVFRLGTGADEAGHRLICFPFAGGTPRIFRSWPEHFHGVASVLAVMLPGRGVRLREPLESDLRKIACDIAHEIKALLDRPYMLFGHSAGGLIAYECICELRRRGLPAPKGLGVASTPPPHLVSPGEPVQTNEQLIERMTSLGANPQEMSARASAMEALLPGIRADFAAFDTYRCTPEPPLDIPILAWAGTKDRIIPAEQVSRWEDYTRSWFRLTHVPAGHSYIEEEAGLIVPEILNLMVGCPPAQATGGRNAG